MNIRTILFIIFIFSYQIGEAQVLNVIDSLKLIYSDQELKEMSFNEQRDAIRKMRGQRPIQNVNEYDLYNIKIIDSIPTESEKQRIIEFKNSIDKRLNEFDLHIFPNAYVDVINGYFANFYNDLRTKELSIEDYKNYSFEMPNGKGGEVARFSNYSQQLYYFDKEKVVKVSIVQAFNVNPGMKMDETEYQPINYKKSEYYFRNDSLLFYENLVASQNIDKYYYLISRSDLDTSKVHLKYNAQYFYKSNCIQNITKESKIDPIDWSNEFVNDNEVSIIKDCTNKEAVVGSILIDEYKEYIEGKNDYLFPTQSSHLKPEFFSNDE